MTKRLWNVSALNAVFGIDGDDWLEVDYSTDQSFCQVPPTNDIGGEDHFHNIASPEMKEARNQSISETYNHMSPEAWQTLVDHRREGNTQRMVTLFDGKEFPSQNAAARYAMEKFCVSRNTAIRYIQEGRDLTDRRQPGREYGGDYTGSKYD